jgi:hypothetical protein
VCNDNVSSTFSPPSPSGFSRSFPPSLPPWVVRRTVSFNLDPGCVYNLVYPTSLIQKSILRPSRCGLQSLNSLPNVSDSLLERHDSILETFCRRYSLTVATTGKCLFRLSIRNFLIVNRSKMLFLVYEDCTFCIRYGKGSCCLSFVS